MMTVMSVLMLLVVGGNRTTGEEPRPVARKPVAIVAEDETPGEILLDLTPYDIERSEARFSPQLREYRRRYRGIHLIRNAEQRQRRMLALAESLESNLPADQAREFPDWLELVQSAYYAGGATYKAILALNTRFDHLQKALTPNALAQKALDEAVMRSGFRQFELADALFDRALHSTTLAPLQYKAIMARGRMMSARSGMDAALDYYRDLVRSPGELGPSIAREAHYQVAEELHRHGHVDAAIEVLQEMERQYQGTPEAEKARNSREGWIKTPDE
jgi:tetratricopeptide (TPR) repeat protein